ncbi:MAG TPA: nuclear transport factor 2 family protein [Thermoleophilaceae bacterium]|nr:nuclear transport factor 2 family protein [Thermoleophilaceae bacterium]
MSREHIEALRGLYRCWAAGDFRSAAWLLDRHVGFVVGPGFPTETVSIGLDSLGRHVVEILEAWERLTVTAESFREVGDSVLVGVRQVGVGAGSGVLTEMTFFHVWTFRAGKVIRLEVILEEGEALEAVGLRE